MNRNRILRISVASFAIGMLLLTACQAATPEAAPTQPGPAPTEEAGATMPPPTEAMIEEATPEMVELTVWNIASTEPFNQWWSDYTDSFNAAHPNINVTYETFETEAYKPKISSAVIAGTAPDIFYQIPGPETHTWFNEGKVLNLDDVLDASRFLPAAAATCSQDGHFVCLPEYLAPSYFYYNKAMFSDAGVDPQTWADPMEPTWEEFLAACDALKAAGHVPLALGNADNWPGLFYVWALQNRYGGVQALEDAISGAGSYEAESFIKAVEVTQDLVSRGYFPDGLNGIGGNQKYTLFTDGIGAMIYQGSWMLANIESMAPEDFEFDIFQFPSVPDGDPDSQTDVMSGIDALWINGAISQSHIDAAGEYLAGFYDPENALDFMLKTSEVPSVVGVVEDAAAAGHNTDTMFLAKGLSNAAHTFPWWDWALPPAQTDEMLSMSQGIFALEVTPQEFGQRLEALRGQ